MESRQERGLEIAQQFRNKIQEDKNGQWSVPSQSGNGLVYTVRTTTRGPRCTCPDCELRQNICKHIWAVDYVDRWNEGGKGEPITKRKLRISYAQNWPAYNRAQVNEGVMFMKLLSDLCAGVEQPEYRFGRPTLPFAEMVFASALKVYSTFSLRRFVSLMRTAKEKGFTGTVCSYSSVSNYMRKPEMTQILRELIKMSSLPLSSVETDFAVDSSGFSTTRFARFHSYKHERDLTYRKWVKAHLICGTKTNIVTGVEISDENRNDSPFFEPLVERTAENFAVKEVSADKAYSSRKNLQQIRDLGGMPYIPFRSNTTAKSRGHMFWSKMWHFYNLHRHEFLKHYHKRSNAETVFHMVKTKFRDSLRSKDKIAQINEVLLKFLCHNICVVIQEMYELSVKSNS